LPDYPLDKKEKFQSISLQRRVACEPEPGVAEIGSGEGWHVEVEGDLYGVAVSAERRNAQRPAMVDAA
jgi:hypothetical protein